MRAFDNYDNICVRNIINKTREKLKLKKKLYGYESLIN